MIGKIIGAYVGDKMAKQTSSVGGATGAALGVVATALLRRMSLPAMITLGAAGYLGKKLLDKAETERKTGYASTKSTNNLGTTGTLNTTSPAATI